MFDMEQTKTHPAMRRGLASPELIVESRFTEHPNLVKKLTFVQKRYFYLATQIPKRIAILANDNAAFVVRDDDLFLNLAVKTPNIKAIKLTLTIVLPSIAAVAATF